MSAAVPPKPQAAVQHRFPGPEMGYWATIGAGKVAVGNS